MSILTFKYEFYVNFYENVDLDVKTSILCGKVKCKTWIENYVEMSILTFVYEFYLKM